MYPLFGTMILTVVRAFIAGAGPLRPATTSASQARQEASGRRGAGSPWSRAPAEAPRRKAVVSDRTIIVGAGPSGLAAAVSLHKKDVPAVLLERQDRVAWTNQMSTRTMDDGLDSGYLPIPERFHTERQYIQHLQAYAAEYDIKPVFDTTVTSAHHDEEAGLWCVCAKLRDGSDLEYVGRFLVVTTGLEKDKGVVSRIPGLLDFSGEVIHSSDYKPGESYSYRDMKVLVFGGGKVDMEVARDLCARGALPIMVTDDIAEMVAHRKSSSWYPVRWFIQTSHALLHFILAGLVLLLSWMGIIHVSALALMNSHGWKLVHAKSIFELVGLLMCLSLCSVEKTMTFLVWTGILLSGVLVNLGVWCGCREGGSPTATHKLVGLLIWSLLSLVEKVIVLLSWFAHCTLFMLVFLMSFLDDLGIIGRWDVAPLALKNSRLHAKPTSFELIRLLSWYLLCLVEKIIAILLAVLGIESPDIHHESGIDLVRHGHISFVPGVTRIGESHVELTDGRALEIDAVILTTGYRSNVPQAQWPPGGNVNSNTGYPNTAFPSGWKGQSGLYAVGFDRRGSSTAYGDPLFVAGDICRRSKKKMPSTTSPGPPSNASIKVVF